METLNGFTSRMAHGFVNCNDAREDIFIHQRVINRNNSQKMKRIVVDGETAVFDIMVVNKEREAANVARPDGKSVQGCDTLRVDAVRGDPGFLGVRLIASSTTDAVPDNATRKMWRRLNNLIGLSVGIFREGSDRDVAPVVPDTCQVQRCVLQHMSHRLAATSSTTIAGIGGG